MLALLLATAVNNHATVQLRAPDGFTREAVNEVAIEFKIQPEWHIYWRNPGDSGEEPRATWKASGATVGELEYPIPQRLPAGPFTNFGFVGEKNHAIVFRVPVRIEGASKEVELALHLTYLICQDACVPEKADLKINVPVAEKGAWKLSFDVKDFPKREGLGSRANPYRSTYSTGEDALRFRLPAEWVNVPAIELFPLTPHALVAGDAGKRSEVEGLAFLNVATDPSATEIPEKIVGLLVDRSNSRAEWIEFEREKFGPLAALGTLIGTIGFAFLGGLLLNLMPCVFPVVSLKILNFVREGSGHPREIRRHAYAYTSGILLSLWLLVGVLLLLRSAGAAIGWGFQLQSPVFLFVLLAIFFVLGLNLVGVFEINYQGPGRLQNLIMKRGYAGSFFTGLLTTIVATPCSAPFMGVAVGAALAGGALNAFAVFTGLAVGLASPYLVLAIRPAWVAKLPRPGAWMETLRGLLAFPLFLTVVWLFWVLAQIAEVGALVIVLAWCVSVAFAAWTLRLARAPRLHRWIKAAALLIFIAASGLAVATLWPSGDRADVGESDVQRNDIGQAGDTWQPYSDERLKNELAAGHSVFVDFTASWCVTCQVNKRLVLVTEAGSGIFSQNKIVRLRADWTRRDSEITNALSRLGRNSVPVYAYYRGGSSEPELLPEILTPAILRNALEAK